MAVRAARREQANPLPGRLVDKFSRIAWLVAHAQGIGIDDVRDPPPFSPPATRGRMMAIAIAAQILKPDPAALARYFGDSVEAMRMACAHAAARAQDDRDFRVTMDLLRSSCAAALRM